MKASGLYVLKEQFFIEMADPYLKRNKDENRPHYYCFKDKEMYWMIPLSSRTKKYQHIMTKQREKQKPCDILHIAKLDNDRDSVFLIQDMFPVTEQYVLR